MKKYIGVKIVGAKAMNAVDAAKRGYQISERNPDEDGYEVTYPGGYKSWCPKDAFEEANRVCDAMPFGHAIEAARKGLKIARAGWNGRGMFLRIVKSCHSGLPSEYTWELQSPDLNEQRLKLAPFLAMKTVGGEFVPWLASQTDILADDWQIVE